MLWSIWHLWSLSPLQSYVFLRREFPRYFEESFSSALFPRRLVLHIRERALTCPWTLLLRTLVYSRVAEIPEKRKNWRETAGIETGSVSGPPPPVSTEIMADLLSSSKNDLLGQHESGKDGDDSGEGNKIKSEKECMDSSYYSGSVKSWHVDVCTITSDGRPVSGKGS